MEPIPESSESIPESRIDSDSRRFRIDSRIVVRGDTGSVVDPRPRRAPCAGDHPPPYGRPGVGSSSSFRGGVPEFSEVGNTATCPGPIPPSKARNDAHWGHGERRLVPSGHRRRRPPTCCRSPGTQRPTPVPRRQAPGRSGQAPRSTGIGVGRSGRDRQDARGSSVDGHEGHPTGVRSDRTR